MSNITIDMEMSIEHIAFQLYKYANIKVLIVVDRFDIGVHMMKKIDDHLKSLREPSLGRIINNSIRLNNGGDVNMNHVEDPIKGQRYDMIFVVVSGELSPDKRAEIITSSVYNEHYKTNMIYEIQLERL